MPTLYSIIHGPEIWLGVVGLCGLGMVAVIGVCAVNSGRLREREEEMRRDKHERKNDL